jgi:hypothetical protein
MNLKLLGLALRIHWVWLQKKQAGCWAGMQLLAEPEVQAMFDESH